MIHSRCVLFSLFIVIHIYYCRIVVHFNEFFFWCGFSKLKLSLKRFNAIETVTFAKKKTMLCCLAVKLHWTRKRDVNLWFQPVNVINIWIFQWILCGYSNQSDLNWLCFNRLLKNNRLICAIYPVFRVQSRCLKNNLFLATD